MEKEEITRKNNSKLDDDVIDFMKLVDMQNELNFDTQLDASLNSTDDNLYDKKSLNTKSILHVEKECKKLENLNLSEQTDNVTNTYLDFMCASSKNNAIKRKSAIEPKSPPEEIHNVNWIKEGSDKQFSIGSVRFLDRIQKSKLDIPSHTNNWSGNKALKHYTKILAKKSLSDHVNNTKLIVLDNDSLDLKTKIFNEELKINKYPGYLYINLYSIEGYSSTSTDVRDMFVRVEYRSQIFETHDCKESAFIKINDMTYFTVNYFEESNVKFFLYKRTSTNLIKACEASLLINKDFIEKIHNNLVKIKLEWNKYVQKDVVSMFKSFFNQSRPDATSLNINFSFISEEEFKVIGISIPVSLYQLGRWIKIRKYFYNVWYSGFCNIRGNIPNICTHLWKRRFIKVYGYKIYIFNEHTKNLIGRYNLLDVFDKESKIFTKESVVCIQKKERIMELLFESFDKHNKFKNILDILL